MNVYIKNSANALKRLTTVLLMALCLFSMAVPAVATDIATAPKDIRYGILIECNYFDIENSDTVDRSIYEENVFLLSSKTSELYAIAEYTEEKQTYVVTEYTAEQDKATRFRCSTDANLRISGLAPDTYLLDHTETHSGYNTISDVEISLTADIPTVNGTALTIQTDPATGNAIYSFPILIPKYFDLPMGKCDLICWSYGTFGFDIITPLLCAGTIGCSIAIFFVIRSSRKK